VRACTIAKLEGQIRELQESLLDALPIPTGQVAGQCACKASCGRLEHNLWFPNPSTLISK